MKEKFNLLNEELNELDKWTKDLAFALFINTNNRYHLIRETLKEIYIAGLKNGKLSLINKGELKK